VGWSLIEFRLAQQHPRSKAVELGDCSIVQILSDVAVIVRRLRRTMTRRQTMVSMVALCPTLVWVDGIVFV
jgi:hypothetical protein